MTARRQRQRRRAARSQDHVVPAHRQRPEQRQHSLVPPQIVPHELRTHQQQQQRPHQQHPPEELARPHASRRSHHDRQHHHHSGRRQRPAGRWNVATSAVTFFQKNAPAGRPTRCQQPQRRPRRRREGVRLPLQLRPQPPHPEVVQQQDRERRPQFSDPRRRVRSGQWPQQDHERPAARRAPSGLTASSPRNAVSPGRRFPDRAGQHNGHQRHEADPEQPEDPSKSPDGSPHSPGSAPRRSDAAAAS